jgi:hypothetical protein
MNYWIYCTLYIHTTRGYKQYSAIAILHTSQFTVAHALGFSVFTCRILATDLSQSYYDFRSHMKCPLHSLTHFLPLFCSYQFWKLDSVQFLCSQAHILAGLRLETRLCSFDYSLLRPFITPRHEPHRKDTQRCWGGVFTDPLPRNGRPILARTGSRGNAFTEPLPSNGYTHHSMKL